MSTKRNQRASCFASVATCSTIYRECDSARVQTHPVEDIEEDLNPCSLRHGNSCLFFWITNFAYQFISLRFLASYITNSVMERSIFSLPVPADIEQGIDSSPSTQCPEDVLARQDPSFEAIENDSPRSSYSKGEISNGVEKSKLLFVEDN